MCLVKCWRALTQPPVDLRYPQVGEDLSYDFNVNHIIVSDPVYACVHLSSKCGCPCAKVQTHSSEPVIDLVDLSVFLVSWSLPGMVKTSSADDYVFRLAYMTCVLNVYLQLCFPM